MTRDTVHSLDSMSTTNISSESDAEYFAALDAATEEALTHIEAAYGFRSSSRALSLHAQKMKAISSARMEISLRKTSN